MTSRAKQRELGRPAEQADDGHAAVPAVDKTETEGDERAAVARIKARHASVFLDAFAVGDPVRP